MKIKHAFMLSKYYWRHAALYGVTTLTQRVRHVVLLTADSWYADSIRREGAARGDEKAFRAASARRKLSFKLVTLLNA